uniref:Uncharacterized protein n=1 Tax=Lactuca sativa TaxID=4236 RepID=A0A9R1UYQ9_LACSA|nr:hypothetical protein LSAT_V11C700358980 [Lactuca sativa]
MLSRGIYTLHYHFSVCELRLDPNQQLKWTLLETRNFPKPDLSLELVSSGDNLYVISHYSIPFKVLELDIEEMKWTIGEYAFFLSKKKSFAAIKSNLSHGSAFGHNTRAMIASLTINNTCAIINGCDYHHCISKHISSQLKERGGRVNVVIKEGVEGVNNFLLAYG